MALTIATPCPAQVMIAVAGVKELIGHKGHKNGLQRVVERGPVRPLGLAFVIALEGT